MNHKILKRILDNKASLEDLNSTYKYIMKYYDSKNDFLTSNKKNREKFLFYIDSLYNNKRGIFPIGELPTRSEPGAIISRMEDGNKACYMYNGKWINYYTIYKLASRQVKS